MAGQTAFARQVQLFSDQVGEFRRQSLITLAKESLAEAEAQNASVIGHIPPHQTIVDGKQGAQEQSVKLGGTIVYLFAVGAATLQNAVDEAFKTLAELSPVKSGRYENSFRLLVNGVERDAALSGAEVTFKETDEIEITNLQPYSRKLERGWSDQAPNGVVEVATTAIRSRYGHVLAVSFKYDHFPGHEIGVGRSGARLHPSRKADFRRAALYPTMLLRVK